MRPEPFHAAAVASLRAEIARVEGGRRAERPALPFGVAALDARLPQGGLAFGALHEATSGLEDEACAAAATLFVAGVAARAGGRVLWGLAEPDLFAPALAQAGLAPERALYFEADDDRITLACAEEGLRHGSFSAVVAEVALLPMAASRRLQPAAEASGAMALALRRPRRRADAQEFLRPNAASTRWRVSALPSSPLPTPGVGRARWRVELWRCRGAESAAFELEACDGEGRLAVPADMADRSSARAARLRLAAS